MQLPKTTLNDHQYANFVNWVRQHVQLTVRKYGVEDYEQKIIQRFLSHHYGVQMLDWHDRTFISMNTVNLSMFVLAMSGERQHVDA